SYYLSNIFLDALIATISLFIAYAIRTWIDDIVFIYDWGVNIPSVHSFKNFSWLLYVIIPLWPIFMDINGAYSSIKFISFQRALWIYLKSVIQATIILVILMFVFKIEGVSRIFLFLISIVSFVLLAGKEVLFRVFFFSKKKANFSYRNILIVCSNKKDCIEFINIFNSYFFWGLKVFGVVPVDDNIIEKKQIAGVPVLGSLNKLSNILVENPIDEVVFPREIYRINKIENLLKDCEELGIRTRIPLNFFNLKIAKPTLESFHDIPILTFTTTSTKVLDLFIKYTLDRIAAFFLIIFMSPVFLFIALLIKITSRGPVVFSQIRSGLNGRTFSFYKFRSMYEDAESRLGELKKYNEMDGPVFKMRNDPRITPLGKFLRKSSLDELPQLFNVLKGEMSIVGPRPPIPKEVEKYERWQRRKLSMKPGLTCLWQISGRNQITDFDEWMHLDLEYIDNWSLWLDFKIMCKTVVVLLTMKGAH
ncbi:sugar transferase, partial [bacterium]|nr:sugar transferase [bacterium]